ncbi:stage VI sporulation protein F [Cohnella nanjingensis]|uniref:Stage VI sporulation protein F n=1 Tax=Cohnella nanjingensis TaxID=1387779 RepID=A0A7X0RXJ1_9BACL|nr:stage VI sporulation protein F [Cohnella nanjingensis]MBB6675516.1 stage VI sporulation protein F [Cohnella nanjingensis]
MSWQKFGIRPELVERVKFKMKNPATKDRIKAQLEGVNKYDLQDRAKVKRLVKSAGRILNEPLTDVQEDQLVNFVIAQKIDPNNTLHLIRLWAMFR